MNIKKLISKSVDFKYFFGGLLWFGICGFIFLIISIILSRTDPSTSAWAIVTIFLCIFLIPLIVYYIVRIALLFIHTKDCCLYSANIIEVRNNHFSLFRACSFVLEIYKNDGSTFTAETASVFKTSDLTSTYFGNFINKPVQVLYNQKSELLIVISA